MYGTIAQMRIKSGAMDRLLKMSRTWESEHGTNVDGFIASYVFQMDEDSDECWLIAIFEDRDRYMANAARPEQDQWYQKMREHLTEDPIWHDGEIIHSTQRAKPEPAI